MPEGMQEHQHEHENDPIKAIEAKCRTIYHDLTNKIMTKGRTPAERGKLFEMIDSELQELIEKIKEAGVK